MTLQTKELYYLGKMSVNSCRSAKPFSNAVPDSDTDNFPHFLAFFAILTFVQMTSATPLRPPIYGEGKFHSKNFPSVLAPRNQMVCPDKSVGESGRSSAVLFGNHTCL